MAENTKMPPNQDQRQRTPQNKPSGDAKPQKSGGPSPSGAGPDRDRQGVNNPGKPIPDKQAPGAPIDDDDDLDEGVTRPIDRE
jgi:hypothetical protein